jgi:hypothetical protein
MGGVFCSFIPLSIPFRVIGIYIIYSLLDKLKIKISISSGSHDEQNFPNKLGCFFINYVLYLNTLNILLFNI